MIQTEIVGDRIRSYSDKNVWIRQDQTGVLYEDAVDIPNLYTYTETDIPIPREAVEIDERTIEPTMRFMMNDGLVSIPQQDEPDYFNEHEPEPDYFNEGD